MHFHRVHGRAVKLFENATGAKRSEDFCNGIAFSSQPVKVNQRFCLELTQAQEWSGALRIGLTSHDPSHMVAADLPRYVCPDLTNRNGFWARGLQESYAQTGNRVTFYLNYVGQLHYFVNNEHKGVLLGHLATDVPLWILFDIYGNTTSAKFVSPDEAPVEITARGPDAMRAYHQACESGMQSVFRTRLMLVGQDRVGKTSLKKSLLGLKHSEVEQSTDGIDLSASCSFNLRDRNSWKLALNVDKDTEQTMQHTEQSRSGIPVSLEEEYYQALATNIVQELLHRKKVKDKEELIHRKTGPVARSNTAKRKDRSATGLRHEQQETLSNHELLGEIPQRVAELVEQMWKSRQRGDLVHTTGSASQEHSGRNVTLNIWDFAGQAAYYTTHQVFLSTRAVYVIVFSLCHDLEQPMVNNTGSSPAKTHVDNDEMSCLDYMDFWMNSIHAHTAQNTRNSVDNTNLSPPIFLVGTHRKSLEQSDGKSIHDIIEAKYEQIRLMIKSKPYEKHVVMKFYAVENNVLFGEDPEIIKLRQHIEEIASKESYMGEQMPLKWLKFEQAAANMPTNFASLEQVEEVAQEVGITNPDEFSTLLAFYHDLGVLVYYGSPGTLDSVLRNTVILKPQWLIDMFRRFITAHNIESQPIDLLESWQRLSKSGLLDDSIINHVWSDVISQKTALLGLMEKFDLICPCLPIQNLSPRESYKLKAYYVPSRVQQNSENVQMSSLNEVVFYVDFFGFLPDGLFHRLLTRAIRWSQDCGGHVPMLYYKKGIFFMDPEHDFILEMSSFSLARIKVSILRVVDLDDSEDSDSDTNVNKVMPTPKPYATAKVRNFLESSLSDLRELWMKRMRYQMCVQCECERMCYKHGQPGCLVPDCMHFLSLDECLSSKIVCCEHRRIKTSHFRKWFPSPRASVRRGPILPDFLAQETLDNCSNIETLKDVEFPSWVRSAAKLLNGGSDGQDWAALATKLGYKKNKLEKFGEDLNPGLATITNWIVSSGNTPLSVDMMISYLEQMHRDDIVEILHKGRECEVEPAQVFISYQWDNQDDVQAMRERLERAGFHCWMDIGQMGGGDQLNAKIDEGIRGSKVVLSCVSTRYVMSHHCNRELSLADLLRKPIIPIMFEKVPWPPPGGMALVFSQLVYVDIKGVGGHGGAGIHADLEERYKEIIQRVSQYAVPDHKEMVPLSPREPPAMSDVFLSDPAMTMSSDTQVGGYNPPMLIPGYGGQEYTGSPPGAVASQQSTPRDQAEATGPVQQAHVTKCAVCNIL